MGKLIETEIWEDVPDKPHTVRYVDQRPAADVFNELAAHLKSVGLLPDEYFLLSHNLQNEDDKMPKGDMVAFAEYGSNEGVYLEVAFRNGTGFEHFATGKTLYTSNEAMARMAMAAGEVQKVFMGQGEENPIVVAILSEEEKYFLIDNCEDRQSHGELGENEEPFIQNLLDKLQDHDGTLEPSLAEDEMEL